MITLMRCNSNYKAFRELVECLDADLIERNGEGQNQYNPYNIIHNIPTVIIAMDGDLPIGCGCFKKHDDKTVEIKRMYVKPGYRNQGIAGRIIGSLEQWANELGYREVVLETGVRQKEAQHLYEKCGYQRIDNYDQYAGMEDSVCYAKSFAVHDLG